MPPNPIYKSPAGEAAVMRLYDAALAAWPVPYETLTVPTRHGETFVIAGGDPSAPPLVLLHGAASCSAVWGEDVAAYSPRCRVYAADQPGDPGKSAPNRLAWQGPAYAEWLADVLDGLHVERAALVGISQGGFAALKFAAAYPERVAKLALLTPGGVAPERMSFVWRMVALSLLGRRGARAVSRLLLGDEPLTDGFQQVMDTVSAHYKPRVEAMPRFPDDDLRRLTMPVLLIGGDKDVLQDMDRVAARLRALLPCLEVAILPGKGHALMHTAPRVLAWLG